MKVYITRYALTRGILETDVLKHGSTGNMVYSKEYHKCFFKPDWHETKKTAIERADIMRLCKIASLKKSLSKMENFVIKCE